jgi:hypothetical protein
MFRSFLAGLFYFLICFSALAQMTSYSDTRSTTVRIPRHYNPDEPSEDFRPSLGFRTSYSLPAGHTDSSAYGLKTNGTSESSGSSGDSFSDHTKSESLSYSLSPGFSYGGYSYGVNFSYTQSLADTTRASFSDPGFNVDRKSWKISDYFTLKPAGTLVLPMTDRSKNDIGLLYNIGGGLNLSLVTKAFNMDAWDFGAGLAVNRNFTQYATNSYGEPSNMWRIRQKYHAGYDLTESLNFSTSFDFSSNYSVNGVVTNTFSVGESFRYKISRGVSMSMGHSNGGPTLTPFTYDNNMKLYDQKSSTYSVGVSFRI